MIDITEMRVMLEDGAVPFSFTVDGQACTFGFQHQRTKRRRPGVDYVYGVAGHPITVVMETNHVPGRDLFTWRFRLVARENLEARVANVKIMDLRFPGGQMLRGWNGGGVRDRETGENIALNFFPPKEYRIWDIDLAEEGEVMWEDLLGRASHLLLPVWFLYNEEGGAWFGQEWSGSWRMSAGLDERSAWAWIQLPCLDFGLLQGEEVQLPPVSIGTYAGSIGDGCVQLRRTIREEFMPTIEGKRPLPAVQCHAIGGSIPEWDARGFREEVKLCYSLGIEQIVFASAWYRPPTGSRTPFSLEQLQEMYPGTRSVKAYESVAFWEQCGSFEPYDERFPGGLKACSQWMKEGLGIILGLWYDPRINVMTEPYQSLRDCLARNQAAEPNPACDLDLIDMGIEAGRELMFELMERFVVEFGAQYLWHDLCCHPRRGYWDGVEQEGRRGLKELRHYIGQDQVYDRFREKYPDVWIEWCGGGGSMLNLGLFRRAHTFHIADCCGIRDAEKPNSDHWRIYRTSLNWILPATYINNHFGPAGGMYEKHDRMGVEIWLSQMGSMLNLHRTISRWSTEDRADAAEAIGVFKNYRKYLNRDFWSLFPPGEDRESWDGWQFHDPDADTGILMFFKRRDCEEGTQIVELRWPDDISRLTFGTVLGEATVEVKDGRCIAVAMEGRAALIRYDRGRNPASERHDWTNSESKR
jgi:hypothetical protein